MGVLVRGTGYVRCWWWRDDGTDVTGAVWVWVWMSGGMGVSITLTRWRQWSQSSQWHRRHWHSLCLPVGLQHHETLFQDGESVDAALVTASVFSSLTNLTNTIVGAGVCSHPTFKLTHTHTLTHLSTRAPRRSRIPSLPSTYHTILYACTHRRLTLHASMCVLAPHPCSHSHAPRVHTHDTHTHTHTRIRHLAKRTVAAQYC
jgi:hypothetical protein